MIFKQLLQNKIIAAIAITLVVAGAYLSYQGLTGNDATARYLTAVVERGRLIVSVSGSGQVAVSDQVDIKPKVSGELAGLYIKKDQDIEEGYLLAVINTSTAQRAVSEAEISLESAKISLEELLSEPDAQSLLQAQNALAQAERDFEIAERNYGNIEEDTEQTLTEAYEDGYADVSTSFFTLSEYMQDLKNVLGTEDYVEKYITSYKLILGKDSFLIQRFIDNYYQAEDLYNESFTFFGGVFQDDERDQIYKLVNDTLEAAKATSRTLESARHMYDAITAKSYHQYYVSSVIDSMKPKIENDLSGIFSTVGSLQNTIDIINDTVQDMPDKIKDAELALKSAEEKLADKKLALEDLEGGPDPLDIRTQQNVVAQKEAALTDAKAELADCYIYSPFSGVVATVNSDIKKGDTISSSLVLATIITEQKIAEITINEIDAAQVKINQKANITLDAVEDMNITGKVTEIDTLGTVTQGVVTYDVKIALDTQEDRIKPGMSLSAVIITEAKKNVLLVSNLAIKQQGDTSYVQVVDGANIERSAIANISGAVISVSGLHMRLIQTGISNDTMTEITDGLEEGDTIVVQTVSLTSQNQSQQSSRFGGSSMQGGTFRMMH